MPDTVLSPGRPDWASLMSVVAPLSLVIAMVVLPASDAIEKANVAAATSCRYLVPIPIASFLRKNCGSPKGFLSSSAFDSSRNHGAAKTCSRLPPVPRQQVCFRPFPFVHVQPLAAHASDLPEACVCNALCPKLGPA